MPKKAAKKKPVNKGGRPKSRPDDAAYLGIWVAKSVLKKAQQAATSAGVTRSEVIREWLSERAEREK